MKDEKRREEGGSGWVLVFDSSFLIHPSSFILHPSEGGRPVLNRIIDFSLRHRFPVILGAVAFAVAGAVSLRYLDIDAFPDTTPVQVQVNTVAPSLGPSAVEQQLTFPSDP